MSLFKGRLNRRNYLIGMAILLSLFVVLISLLMFSLPSNSNDVSGLTVLIFLVFDIPLLVFGASLLVRRLHDLGKSGWYCLLLFFPLVMWIFLLWILLKGGQGDNKYGSKPSQKIKFPSDILGK